MKKNMPVLLFVAALGTSATASGPCAAGSATTFTAVSGAGHACSTEKTGRERPPIGFLI